MKLQPHFEEVLRIDPLDADSHYQLGVLLRARIRRRRDAHLERALEILPHHQSACTTCTRCSANSTTTRGPKPIVLDRFQ